MAIPPLFSEAPVLQTARLILRGHRATDAEPRAQIWSDPQVIQFVGAVPQTPHQSWMRLLAYVGHWRVKGFGYWAVEEIATQKYIGEVGFADFQREITPPLAFPECGWVLASSAHRRGYATEAVTAIHAWSDQNLNSANTTCIIHPDNYASVQIARKMGYYETRRTQLSGSPLVVFERVRVKSKI